MESDLTPLRRRILETAYHAGEGHVPSALSILEIVQVLYTDTMSPNGERSGALLDKANWQEPDADCFVLSKGHGCLALYAVLEACAFIGGADMATFCKRGGGLGGHPDADKIPGVWASTGSLGHGLPIAVGMAYAKKIRGDKGRVFCLVGDGEMQEGSALEALRLVQALDVANLCLIVDCNGSHGKSAPLFAILRGFEFHVRIVAGHDRHVLPPALSNYSTYPVAVMAQTIKGYGIPAMAKDPAAWHRRTPTADEYRKMMEFLA